MPYRKPLVNKIQTLRIVCTDRGQHVTREVQVLDWSRIIWSVEDLSLPGEWTLTPSTHHEGLRHSDKVGHVYLSLARDWPAPPRQSCSVEVEVTHRADGGQTFTFSPCPACGRRATLRDDRLTNYFRKTYSTPLRGVLDISLNVC